MSDREKVINDMQMQIEELEERLAIVLEGQPEVEMMDRGKTIEKKILPEYFRAVKDRVKTFELRKDDSDYQVGDILKLREWDGEKYTGNFQFRQITYILRDCPEYGLQPGFCILAIQGTMWEAELRRKPMAVLD